MFDNFHRIDKQKQDAIIGAAMTVFAKHGYHKASTNEIVKLANISKGLLFHYFGSKTQLFQYIYRYALDYTRQIAPNNSSKKNRDLFEVIDSINKVKMDMMIHYPAMSQFLLSAYYETHPDVVDFIQLENKNYARGAFSPVKSTINTKPFKDGIDLETAWNALLWMSDGFIKMQLDRGHTDPDQLFNEFEKYKNILRHGIYKK